MIKLYIPCPSKETAKAISTALLKKRLVACANIFPIESMYWWKRKIEEAKEYVLLAATTEEKADAAKKEIKRLHPYKVPLIGSFNMEANKEYEQWLRKETKK